VSDITTFRSHFGLTANNPAFIVNGADPGDLGPDEDVEADLDMEWSGAVAPNATSSS
jgi:subtilase family serine protease